MLDSKHLKADLKIHWIVVYMMFLMLPTYLLICHFLADDIRLHLPEQQRSIIRSILYIIAIIGFPMTNLIRHIQLRLNQTMPGDTPAKNRYLVTIIVSMALSESSGIFGFIMFILGDDFNTLYIFTCMSALAMFLYRPKIEEYISVIEGMETRV